MSKPPITKKAQIKAGIISLAIEAMEAGDMPLDMRFVAEQVEWLAEVEAQHAIPQAATIETVRELLAYIDGLPE